MTDKLELNAKAQELRTRLGVDANTPVDIFSLINLIPGLTLLFYPFSEQISGICWQEGTIRLIALNSTMSYGRQRFSLAHELYHLYYDSGDGFIVCTSRFDGKSDVERDADQFASYFLAPYNSLRTAVRGRLSDGPLSLNAVIELEQYYGMSHQAMLWRLVSEDYLTGKQADDYSTGVIAAARMLGYPESLYHASPRHEQRKTYGHYLKQVDRLKKLNAVSDGKLDELLLDAFRDDLVYGEGEMEVDAFD